MIMTKIYRRLITLVVAIGIMITTCANVSVLASEGTTTAIEYEKMQPKLNKSSITVCVGKTTKIYADKISSEDELLSVHSTNKQIASVSKKGNKAILKGKKNGSCRVVLTYRINGKKQKLKCKVTVPKTVLNSTKANINIDDKKTVSLINKGTQNYQLLKVATSNKKVARATKNGNKFQITGIGKGNATISATYKLGKKNKVFKCKVIVSEKDIHPSYPDSPVPTFAPTIYPTLTPIPTFIPSPTPTPTLAPVITTECSHIFEKAETKSPTCEEIGFDILKCSKCGEEIYKNIKNPFGHDYEGMICKRCGYEDISMIYSGHVFAEPLVVEATCETEGFSLYECVDHDYEYKSDYVPCLGHNYNQIDENANTFVAAATCTNGSVYRYRCSNCGKIGGDEDVYEKDDCLGHVYNIVSERVSTCVDAGERIEECVRCNDVKVTSYPLVEHELDIVSVCDDKTFFECKNCKQLFSQNNDINDEENTEGIDVDIKINEDGLFEIILPEEWMDISKAEIQADDGQVVDVTESIIMRDGRAIIVIDATDCLDKDKYLVVTDSIGNVGKRLIKKISQPIIKQLDNASEDDIPEGDASVTYFDIKEPTCTESGVRRYINISASASISILDLSIPAKGHVLGEPQITKQEEAGCEKEGIIEKTTYCCVCNEAVSCASTIIEATGHRKGEQRTVVYHSGQTSPVDDSDYREYMYYNCLNGCGDEFDKIYFSSTKGDSGIAAIYSSLGYAKAGTKGEIEVEINKYYTFDGWYHNDIKVTNQLCYDYTTTNVANHFEARTTKNFLKNTNVTYRDDFFDIRKDTLENYDSVISDGSKVVATIDPNNLHKTYSIDVKPNEPDAKISYHLLAPGENVSALEDVEKLTWINSNPKIYTWGTYDIYYKIEKENWRTFYGHSIITINRAKSNATVSLNDWTYGEQENHTEVDSDSLREIYVEEGVNEAVIPVIKYYTDKDCTKLTGIEDIDTDGATQVEEGSCPTEAGTYYVKAVFPENNVYEECEAIDEFKINKAEGSVVAPTAKTLTYNGTSGNNGSEQTLIEKGSSDTGLVEYSVDKLNWVAALPKATGAGKYNIYYRVSGDRNHKDVTGDNLYVEAIIKKAPGKISINASSGETCSGNTLRFSVVNNKSGGTITLMSSNSGVAEVSGSADATVKCKSTGSTNIIVTSAETSNYESASTSYTVTFKKHEEYKIQGGTRVSSRSCTQDGVLHYKCSKCDKDISETYIAENRTGHNKTKPNTTGVGECGGVAGYYTCYNCGEKGSSYDTRYNHSGDNVGDIIEQATCVNAGGRYQKCVTCGANYGYVTIDALGHNWTECGGNILYTVERGGSVWNVSGMCHKCSRTSFLGSYTRDDYINNFGGMPSNGAYVKNGTCKIKNYCSRCKCYR